MNLNDLLKSSFPQLSSNNASLLSNFTPNADVASRGMNMTSSQPFQSGQGVYPGMSGALSQNLDPLSQLMQLNRSYQNKNPYNWAGQDAFQGQMPRMQTMPSNLLQMQQQLAQQQAQNQQSQFPMPSLNPLSGGQNPQFSQQAMEDYLAQLRKMPRDPRFDKP